MATEIALNGAYLAGESELAGAVTMRGEAAADPTEAPLVETAYLTLDASAYVSNPRGLSSAPASGTVILDGDTLVQLDGDGVVINSGTGWTDYHGVVLVGVDYAAVYTDSGGQLVVDLHDTSPFNTVIGGGVIAATAPVATWVASDGTNLYILVDNNDGTLTVKQIDPTDGSTLVANVFTVTLATTIGAFWAGSADFAGARFVIHPASGDALVYDATGALQAGETWPRPDGATVAGMAEVGAGLVVIDDVGTLRYLEEAADQPGGTGYWSYAWTNEDGTYHTAPSPETTHVSIKRARTRIIAPNAPQAADVGDPIANCIAIYDAATSGGTKGITATLTPTITSHDAIFAEVGTHAAAPTTNNWATVLPAGALVATNGGFRVDGESNGDIGNGTLRDSAVAAVPAASETVAGKAELATQAEVDTGTDDARIVTPLKLQTRMAAYAQPLDADLTAFAAKTAPAGAVVGTTDTQTLANKTLTAPAITTPTGLVKGDVGLGNVDNTSDANKPVSTATQTALDLKAPASRTVNAQTGTTYTLALADANGFITFNNAGAIALTVPTNATVAFPTGTRIDIQQINSGAVTISGAGITFRSKGGLLTTNGVNAVVSLCKVGTNTWSVWGDRV